MTNWRGVIDSRISRLYESKIDKRLPLAAAIKRHVKAGMKLNACSLQGRPCAAVFEIARQFKGQKPNFEFISSSIGGTYLALLHLGLLKKAIVSFAGEGYPTPGPSPIIQRALNQGEFELENWTMLTISQRLLAGAMGVPFLPTRSLSGSSMGDELAEAGQFAEVADPFEPNRKAGVLRAYQPDISLVHAWAADPAGNAICFPPLAENVYGALAARHGVILTADHMVSTEFVRAHNNMVRIPGEVVQTVSHCPYGAHPSGNFSQGIPEFRAYANDYKFMIDHRKATKDEKTYDAWLKEWVFDTGSHEAYVKKLGKERIDYIYRMAEPESWRDELEGFAAHLDKDDPPNPVETMIIQASRAAADRIREMEYKTVLSGVGQATLLAWLAAHRLRQEGIEFAMMAETGIYGHDPRPSDPFVFNYRNLPTATLLTDIFETLGLHTGGATNQCLGTIGAGQIDRFGNVNSTRNADGTFIVGSGGANDIVSAARETLVVAQQRKQCFVEKVDYVTSPGRGVSVVVSTMGRYEKRGGKELILTGYFGMNGVDKDTAIREIKDRCGWNLAVADDVESYGPPNADEIAMLRVYDPERFFLGKATEKIATPAGAAS